MEHQYETQGRVAAGETDEPVSGRADPNSQNQPTPDATRTLPGAAADPAALLLTDQFANLDWPEGDPAPSPAPAAVAASVAGAAEREDVLQAEYKKILERHFAGDALIDAWEKTAPSPAALAMLQRVEPDFMSADLLVEAAALASRLEGLATSLKQKFITHLSQHKSMQPGESKFADTLGSTGLAGDEIAMRLRLTSRQGRRQAKRAELLTMGLGGVGEAQKAGTLTSAHAAAIADELFDADTITAMQVEEIVLPTAPRRTPTQLRADVKKALIAIDTRSAEESKKVAAEARHVTRPKRLAHGMAGIWVQGPAPDVIAIDTALAAAATAAKARGDERTRDQLRFDTLAGITHHGLATGPLTTDAGPLPLATQAGHTPTIHIHIPLTQLLPPDGTRKAEGEEASASGSAEADAFLDQLLHSDHPIDPNDVPYLEDYGPIDPATARALAAGGTWKRLVTDPLDGTTIEASKTTYRPSQALADHVRNRDQVCVRPGCEKPARQCQLDHTKPFNHEDPSDGGPTEAANLGPLCPYDHQLKTHAGHTLTQTSPGEFTWTTPTGHTYTTTPSHPSYPTKRSRTPTISKKTETEANTKTKSKTETRAKTKPKSRPPTKPSSKKDAPSRPPADRARPNPPYARGHRRGIGTEGSEDPPPF